MKEPSEAASNKENALFVISTYVFFFMWSSLSLAAKSQVDRGDRGETHNPYVRVRDDDGREGRISVSTVMVSKQA